MTAAAETVVEPALAERLDGYVLRAQTAARAFRPLGQEEVGMPRSLVHELTQLLEEGFHGR